MLFTTYGPVLDIVTVRKGSKGQSMRGQAHVVFRDVQTSTQALRALQRFDLFGKEMVSGSASKNASLLTSLGHCIRSRSISDYPQASRYL